MRPSRFNIRVYGIWINGASVLVNEEQIRGQRVIKFPGGGLELGEGITDGLKREWREELGIEIEVREHFYTTEFFQASAFDDSQVVSIYYIVSGNADLPFINTEKNERSHWLPLLEISAETFTLPIDKVVGRMLAEKFN